MLSTETAAPDALDLVSEMRLRRWARENYVPRNDRDTAWHPVILEEMQAKEQELKLQMFDESMNSSYVPLAPMPVAIHMVHDAHFMSASPGVTNSSAANEVFLHG